MRLLPRPVALFVVVALAAVAGCGSNNTGKIVGKWKATELEQAIPVGADFSVIFEFTADNKFSIAGIAKIAGATQKLEQATGTYRLAAGNTVYLENLNPAVNGKTKSRETITIDGDTMVVKGENGKKDTKLVRVKD